MMIKLKVPKTPAAESVSIGNFDAELKPGGVVETSSRAFADHLIREHGCQEIKPKSKANGDSRSTVTADTGANPGTEIDAGDNGSDDDDENDGNGGDQ